MMLGIRRLSTKSLPAPRLFSYPEVTANLKPSIEIIDAVEQAFGKLARNEVDVPIPMHIGQ